MEVKIAETLFESSAYIQAIQSRQGIKIGCIEEVAFRNGFITAEQLKQIAEPLVKSGYGSYLLQLLKQK